MENLAPEEIERFSRQLILRGWSARFQQFLMDQAVLVDSKYWSAGLYLKLAGVKKITVEGEIDSVAKKLLGEPFSGSSDMPYWRIGEYPNSPRTLRIHESEEYLEIIQLGSSKPILYTLPATLTQDLRQSFIGSLSSLVLIELWRQEFEAKL